MTVATSNYFDSYRYPSMFKCRIILLAEYCSLLFSPCQPISYDTRAHIAFSTYLPSGLHTHSQPSQQDPQYGLRALSFHKNL